MPSRANIHTDVRLTNFAVGYAADNLTWADQAFPVIPVTEQSGKHAVFGAESFTIHKTLIGNRESNWPTVDWEESEASYFCDMHGLSHFVPDAQEASYRAAEERRGLRLIMNKLARSYTKELVDFVTDASNFTNTQATAVDLDTADAADWFQDEADVIRKRCGAMPDTVIMGRDVLFAIIGNSTFKSVVQYTMNMAQVGRDKVNAFARVVGDYIGLDVIVPLSLYNNDNEAALTLADMWPTETCLIYYRGGTGTDAMGRAMVDEGMPTALGRFYWTGDRFTAGIASWRVRDDLTGTGGYHVRGAHMYDLRVTFDDAASLCTSVLSGGGS